MAETKKAFHEQVAEQLIEQLKQGTAPWQRPWHPGEPGSFIPLNPTTGKRYRGINAIQLLGQGRTDQRWMTYKQAAAAGAQVRKGEKGTPIQYWKFSEEQAKTDEAGKPVLDAQGKPVKDDVRLERPRVFFATVFNAEQIDGLPPLQPRKEQEWNALERVEHILHASGALIQHGPQNRAFYRPGSDSIHLPEKGQFPSADTYYATALHELGHWTGHPSRLARDLEHPFGSEAYAKEELRAEIASMIMGDELGIGHDPGQHAAYVGTWIKVLKDDPLEVFRAAADAEKIHAYVLALEQKQVQEQSTEQSQEPIAPVISGSENQEAAMQTLTQSEANAHEQAAELARLEEERVRQDPDSTDEQIAAAREARKSADLAVVLNDADIQRRVAQIESEKPPTPAVNDAEPGEKNLSRCAVPPERRGEGSGCALGSSGTILVSSGRHQGHCSLRSMGTERRYAAAPERPTQPEKQRTQERQYLAVPYGERAAAKAAGALWDKAAKSWFAGAKADKSRLQRWLPENVAGQQGPAMSPRDEFAEALRSIGCVVNGEHPMMDGKKHRISVEGEKLSEKAGSGFYVGHLDGHPAGYVKNNKTGVDMKWKSKGYALDPEQKARLQAEAADKLQARAAEQERLQEQTAQRVAKQMAHLLPVIAPTTYMQTKGIEPQAGVFTDKEGRETYIPATDTDGKQWTMQYIQEDGTKRFAKDSRKEGCFHAIGGLDALAKAPALVIGEGYATASSLAADAGFRDCRRLRLGQPAPRRQGLACEVPGQAYPDRRRRRSAPRSHPGNKPRPQQGRGSGQGGWRQGPATDLRAWRASREPERLYRLQRPGYQERAGAGRH
jgi:putative DNA primase/helicase